MDALTAQEDSPISGPLALVDLFFPCYNSDGSAECSFADEWWGKD